MALLAPFAILAADTTPALPDPIGPAATGEMECYSPDLARKLCASTNRFTVGPDGRIANSATAILERSPAVIMTSVSGPQCPTAASAR